MVLQGRPFILKLIDKIPNFKACWILLVWRMVQRPWQGILIYIFLDFLWICLVGLWCNTKVSPTVSVWSPTKRPPIQLWKANANGSLNYVLKSPILFHIAQFGGMMHWGLWRGKSLSMLDCPNTWNSRSRHWAKCSLCHEDEFVCGLLEGYFITFVKTLACS
jgi:hypothetical protein